MTVKDKVEEPALEVEKEPGRHLDAPVRAAAGEAADRWRQSQAAARERRPFWKSDFTTVSGMEVPPLVGPHEVRGDPVADVGVPGEYPYTRGVHPTGYRGKLWTMRQFAGFGTAQDTNERFRFLLDHGQTGLSVAFDLPTLYGYDCDHEMSLGEVGKCGVSVCSLADMEALFEGIPIRDVSTSMTINSTAPILLAMYLAVAEKQGADWRTEVRGTLQNDILKEYVAQKAPISTRPAASMRMVTDRRDRLLPPPSCRSFNPISHQRLPHPRGGLDRARRSSPSRFGNGLAYVEAAIGRGPRRRRLRASGSRSSSTAHNGTSSRRSRSSAPRDGSGPRLLKRALRSPRTPAPRCCGFHTQTAGVDPDRPAARS